MFWSGRKTGPGIFYSTNEEGFAHMYQVKLYNKISKVGLDDLDPAKYVYGEDMENYAAVLFRSAKLHDTQFPKGLKCIARTGAGVNNIPIDRCT